MRDAERGSGSRWGGAGALGYAGSMVLSGDSTRPLLREERGGEPRAVPPVAGGVLIGGGSRRMGRSKVGLLHNGRSFLAIALEALAQLDEVYLIGDPGPAVTFRGGEPGRTIPDVAGVVGPAAGILAALRHDEEDEEDEERAWVLTACDLPLVTPAVIAWLLAERRDERDVVLPRVANRVQPLLALYEPGARGLLEELVRETSASGEPLSPSRLAGRPRVAVLEPPVALWSCFTNVNTPDDLARLSDSVTL